MANLYLTNLRASPQTICNIFVKPELHWLPVKLNSACIPTVWWLVITDCLIGWRLAFYPSLCSGKLLNDLSFCLNAGFDRLHRASPPGNQCEPRALLSLPLSLPHSLTHTHSYLFLNLPTAFFSDLMLIRIRGLRDDRTFLLSSLYHFIRTCTITVQKCSDISENNLLYNSH